MGGGSSIDREKEFDRHLKTTEIRDNSLRPTEHVQERILSQPKQETQLKWPLPKKEEEKDFVPNRYIDNERYLLLQSQYERVSQFVSLNGFLIIKAMRKIFPRSFS